MRLLYLLILTEALPKGPHTRGGGGGDFLDVDKCCKELKR